MLLCFWQKGIIIMPQEKEADQQHGALRCEGDGKKHIILK